MSKIQAPAWCEHAVPTSSGWEDPDTGELFKSGGFTQAQIDEFHGKMLCEVPTPNVVHIPEPQMLTEAPVGNKSLDEMTKVELEALARQHGIELDRRKRKNVLVETMKDLLED
jgi:hypothetical protein